MKGLGTVINVVCILVGGLCGMLFGQKIGMRMRTTLMSAIGISVAFLGVGGTMEKMLVIRDGQLTSNGSMMMIVSLAVGTILGELLDIDGGVERFGEWLKRKSGSGDDNGFVGGFVNASCTVCIGAMAIVGSIQDGIYGDWSTLMAKGLMDAVVVCIMTASQGKGCVFSAIPVALLQGGVTVAAVFTGDLVSQAALARLSFVGSVLIFCVGLNMLREKKIPVANMLPALVVAGLWPLPG